MKYIVIEEHKNDNLTPIIITKGSNVRIGERSNSNGNWPNWIYCFSEDGHVEGWTPIQIIRIEGSYGIVLEDYSAVELEVQKGETVEGAIELNGWTWCKKINYKDEGWLPNGKLILLK